MRAPLLRSLALAALLVAGSLQAQPPAAAPSEVWDLRPLFASDAAWEAERLALRQEIARLGALSGSLGRHAQQLRRVLDAVSAVNRRLEPMWVYAYALQSTDNRVRAHQERIGLMQQLAADAAAATAWLDPELQALGARRVAAFQRAEPGLAVHSERLRRALRLQPHTLSTQTEGALAALAPVRAAGAQARTLLVDADLRWPELTLDGKAEKINDTSYGRWRQHPDRAVRQQVMRSFFGALGQYENTFGVTLGAHIQDNVTLAKLRRYPSAVAAVLAADEVPESVYRTLVAETRKGLPTLHRYFKLRQRLLGLPDLGYHDIYPAMVQGGERYDLARSRALTLASAAPLGADYQRAMAQALDAGTMHVRPAEGKSGGAYQTAAYGKAPYVFLNHQDDYDSLTTYAHEWGHGLHSVLANATQPFEKSSYPLFIAEIAAITNEVLLSQHLLREARDPQQRLVLLGQELERLRGTYFRQAMFAEFELRTHDAAQAGEALSGQRLTEIYCGLLKDYHGAAQGVMQIEPVHCQEWAFIPHFYRAFYVYQYATSMAAAQFFAERIGQGQSASERAQRDAYLAVLKAGGSRAPVEALRAAGLDMASPAPYQAVVRRMDAVMDEMQALIKAPAGVK